MRSNDMSLLAFHSNTVSSRCPTKCKESLRRDNVSAVCQSSAITATRRPASAAGRTIW